MKEQYLPTILIYINIQGQQNYTSTGGQGQNYTRTGGQGRNYTSIGGKGRNYTYSIGGQGRRFYFCFKKSKEHLEINVRSFLLFRTSTFKSTSLASMIRL